MSCKRTELTPEQARASYREFEYALLYMMSEELRIRRTDEPGEICWEECLEARFFSEDKELHLFCDGESMKAVCVSDEGECESDDIQIQIQKYLLDKRCSGIGKTLVVQEYLEADEDGQIQVKLTRLKGIE
jgi:hypothetical protein